MDEKRFRELTQVLNQEFGRRRFWGSYLGRLQRWWEEAPADLRGRSTQKRNLD